MSPEMNSSTRRSRGKIFGSIKVIAASAGLILWAARILSAGGGRISKEAMSRSQAIHIQIEHTKMTISHVKKVPIESAAALIPILLDSDNPPADPTKEQVLHLVSKKRKELKNQLAETRRELREIESREKDIPIELVQFLQAIKYIAMERKRLIRRQLADLKEDAAFLDDLSPSNSKVLIDRKVALLNHILAFLNKQKMLLMGRDPRTL